MSVNPRNNATRNPANIVAGVASTATTIITIPAGRVWEGWISLNVTVTVAASGAAVSSRATVNIVGATATPAAGVILGVYGSAPVQLATTTAQMSNSDRIFVTIAAGASQATLTLTLNSVSAASASAAGLLIA